MIHIAQPQTCATEIATDIQTASHTIRLLVYMAMRTDLSENCPINAIYAALELALARGADARIVLPSPHDRRQQGRTNGYFVTRMRDAGAQVRYTAISQLQHAKMIVIDNRLCWHMTSNLTAQAFTRNHEINLRILDPKHGIAAARRHQQIWDKSCQY